MIDREELIDYVIDQLNEIVKHDPNALYALIKQRVPCNDELLNHPTVQCGKHDGCWQVGVLGLINGIIGVNDDGWGFICAVVEDGDTLTGFKRTPPRKNK